MTTVVELNDAGALAHYRLAWEGLYKATPRANFAHTYEWLVNWLRHFGPQALLRVLVVETHAGEVLGMLPLVETQQHRRWGPVRVLGYPHDPWGSWYGPLGWQPSATLAAAWRHVAATQRRWQMVDLRWVNRVETDRGRTPAALARVGLEAHRSPDEAVALVDLDAGIEAYWQSRAGRWLRNLRRIQRKLRRESRVEHVRFRPGGAARGDDDPRWDLFEMCVAVSRRSWQSVPLDGAALGQRAAGGFLRATHEAAVARGAVDLNLLLIDDRPAAFAYGYHRGGRVAMVQLGFDASITRAGAGTALISLMLDDGAARGDVLYDLGPGHVHWKQNWLTRTATSCRYTHFAPYSARALVQRWSGGMPQFRASAV